MSRGNLIVGWLCAMAVACQALREPAGVVIFGLAVPVYALLWAWIEATAATEQHRRELHELRLALATIGDPDTLLHRLDELTARAERTAKLPERMEELSGRLAQLSGDTRERLQKLETFAGELVTKEGLGRRLKFGQ